MTNHGCDGDTVARKRRGERPPDGRVEKQSERSCSLNNPMRILIFLVPHKPHANAHYETVTEVSTVQKTQLSPRKHPGNLTFFILLRLWLVERSGSDGARLVWAVFLKGSLH